ncbi:MAG TPA: Ig-like domain-containing protein, partial [Thermoanaerobaculia bacterium]|nr:Ig-like domain-containing protein [Thermoanaerobaculia bacterium]
MIQTASILEQPYAVTADVTTDPMKMDFILSEEFAPAQAGSYTISATALPPLGGSPIVVNHTILVIAAGGNNGVSLPNQPPDLITSLIEPENNAVGVDVNAFPQVVFTEPVKRVAANVTLTEEGSNVQFTIAAVGANADGSSFVISDLQAQNPEVAVTSITLRPREPLKFGKTYTLTLLGGIVDLDKKPTGEEDPKPLRNAPRTFTFRTSQPAVLGSTGGTFAGVGIVVMNDRAYVADAQAPHGKLRIFDIASDPSSPSEVATQYIAGVPNTIAGDPQSPVTDGPLVGIPASTWVTNSPSNFWLYDVTTDEPVRVGVASLSESTQHGVTLRAAMKGRYAYAWTYPIGINVIDMIKARDNYSEASADSRRRSDMFRDLVTEGRGFGQDAVVATIPVPGRNGGTAHIFGLKVGDFVVNGVSQPLIVHAGSLALAVTNPQTLQTYTNLRGQTPQHSLDWGWNVSLGRVADRRVAVAVGTGSGPDEYGTVSSGPVLVVFDMTNPTSPEAIGALRLPGTAADLYLNESLAIVTIGTRTLLISVANPTKPTLVGEIAGIGGRIGYDTGLFFTTNNNGAPGLQVGAIGSRAVIRQMSPGRVDVDLEGETEEAMDIEYQIVSPPPGVTGGKMEILENDQVVATFNLPSIAEGAHKITVPAGFKYKVGLPNLEIVAGSPQSAASRRVGATATGATSTSSRRGRPIVVGITAPQRPEETSTTPPRPEEEPPTTSVFLRPTFEEISPIHMPRGSGDVDVTVRGTLLGALQKVHVRAGTEWHALEVTEATAETVKFTMPAALFETARFLQVSPRASELDSLAFLVSDPALPPVDTATEITINAIDRERLNLS